MSDWAVGDRAAFDHSSEPCATCAEALLIEPDAPFGEDYIRVVSAADQPRFSGDTFVLWFVSDNRAEEGWCSCGYRKVVEDKREACETEFVTLLKRSKVPALLEDEGSCQEVTKQIREWREEDRRAGILWADNKQSERDGA